LAKQNDEQKNVEVKSWNKKNFVSEGAKLERAGKV
jgi:hypothetical protein